MPCTPEITLALNECVAIAEHREADDATEETTSLDRTSEVNLKSFGRSQLLPDAVRHANARAAISVELYMHQLVVSSHFHWYAQ